MNNPKPQENKMEQEIRNGMTKIEISLLCYNEEKHQMEPSIQVRYVGDSHDVPSTDRSPAVKPSDEWGTDYYQWNCFDDVEGLPVFHTMKELRHFNKKGVKLANRLRNELQNETITVLPFKPLYSNVAVGDAVCGWWHVKDMNYGLVIPVQRLPVSDVLKSRLQAWKSLKLTGWDDPVKKHGLDLEAHDLEEHLLWELNVVDMVGESSTDWKLANCTPIPSVGIPKDHSIII
jgi:hypothetical protein